MNNPLDCAQVDKYDIDVFVANAAIGQGGPLAELPVENLSQIFEKNVFRSLELVQLVAKQMVAKKKGKLITCILISAHLNNSIYIHMSLW